MDFLINDDEVVDLARKGAQNESTRDLMEKVTSINVRQLNTSIAYKRERMTRIKKFEELYQGKVPRKFRQLFNVNFPIFTSFVDTLESDFSDPITALFKERDPSDYFKVKKVQSAWNEDRNSLKPSGMWNLKVRLDRKNAILSGRGIQKYYASSDPEYESHFDVVNYQFFHCQPTGGAHLENHLFAGEEMIIKTRSQLIAGVESGIYDEEGVRNILTRFGNKDFWQAIPEETMAKFKALGLDPNSNNYVGEDTYALVQFVSTYKGRRYYNLFEPLTKTAVRFDTLKEVYSGEYMPWTSWATHEDQQIFWSVGYGDFFYPIADAAITMVNQELTNREKQNFNARAYDETMFTDEQKLDEAQYRPDSLVPANTNGGARKIAEGIYRFDTPQLSGTINLVDWLFDKGGTLTGSGDLQQGAPPKGGTRAYVQFMKQQQIAKRLSYKAQSYQEAYQQIALRYIQGLKDHMTPNMAIKLVGPEGYDHWDTITRMDLSLKRTPHIEIQSTTAQEQANKMSTDEKMSALGAVTGSPHINERTRVEFLLRQGGHFDDMDIAMLMDTNSSIDKEVQAKAAIAIKELIQGREPEINYSADLVFLKLIQKFQLNHLTMLKKKGLTDDFAAYIERHAPIVKENMSRMAKSVQMEKAYNALKGGVAPEQQQPGDGGAAVKQPVNTQAPKAPAVHQ